MDNTELRKKAETLGILESSILSAHMKFFKRNSEAHYHPEDEEFFLYESVINYFADNS